MQSIAIPNQNALAEGIYVHLSGSHMIMIMIIFRVEAKKPVHPFSYINTQTKLATITYVH